MKEREKKKEGEVVENAERKKTIKKKKERKYQRDERQGVRRIEIRR